MRKQFPHMNMSLITSSNSVMFTSTGIYKKRGGKSNSVCQQFSEFSMHMNHLGILLNAILNLWWGLRFCASNKLLADVTVARLQQHIEYPVYRYY